MGQDQAVYQRCSSANLEQQWSSSRKTMTKTGPARVSFYRRSAQSYCHMGHWRILLVSLTAACIAALLIVSPASSTVDMTDDESVFAPITMHKVASKWRGYLTSHFDPPRTRQLQLYYPRRCSPPAKSCAIIMPSFIIAGSEHSGTSYVFNTLRLHPQVVGIVDHEQNMTGAVSSLQQPVTQGESLASFEEYLSQFPLMHDGIRAVLEQRGEVVVGEHAPQYLYKSHWTARRLRELLPDVKLVFILRDPIDRAFAQYNKDTGAVEDRDQLPKTAKTLMTMLTDFNLTFETVIERELPILRQCCHTTTSWEGFIRCHQSSEIRASHQTSEDTRQDAQLSDTLARGMYYSALLPFLKQFPPNQLFVIRTEDFLDNPSASFQRLARFLGIDESHFSESNFYRRYSPVASDLADRRLPVKLWANWKARITRHTSFNRLAHVNSLAEVDGTDLERKQIQEEVDDDKDSLWTFNDAPFLDLGTRYRLQKVFRQLNAQLLELFGNTDFKGWEYDVDRG